MFHFRLSTLRSRSFGSRQDLLLISVFQMGQGIPNVQHLTTSKKGTNIFERPRFSLFKHDKADYCKQAKLVLKKRARRKCRSSRRRGQAANSADLQLGLLSRDFDCFGTPEKLLQRRAILPVVPREGCQSLH